MDKIFEAFAELILQHGLTGVVIATLLYALYRFVDMYHEAQTGRVTDGRDAAKALADSTLAIRELREAVLNRKD